MKTNSPVQKDFKGVTPGMTLAYSTNGSGTHITALRFMKDYGFQAKLIATGNVPATFTSVMSGQVDIGFSTPPFGLEAAEQGQIRIVALANDLESIRTQTVRDRFYPKAMLQLDEVKGLDEMMQDAIAFKYITQPLPPQQGSELLQLPGRRR